MMMMDYPPPIRTLAGVRAPEAARFLPSVYAPGRCRGLVLSGAIEKSDRDRYITTEQIPFLL
jgi:hypothetical protein